MNKEDTSYCIFKTKCFGSEYERLVESSLPDTPAKDIKLDIESNLPDQGGSYKTIRPTEHINASYKPSEKFELEIYPPSKTGSDPSGQGGSNQSKRQPGTNPASYQHSITTPPPGDRKKETTGNQPWVPYSHRWCACKTCVTVFFGITILVVNVVMFCKL